MSEVNIATVRAFYDAFARGDVDGALSIFSADAEYRAPQVLPYGGTYHGPDEIRGYLGHASEYLADARLVNDSFLDAGDYVVALGTLHARGRKTGRELTSRQAAVFKVVDGKAVLMQYYTDTATILAAIVGPGG